MRAWKVLAVLMVVALGVTMSAQAGMLPGTPGDGIPDLYVDVVPPGYDPAGTATGNYVDPLIDTLGVWIDADGAVIGNGISIGPSDLPLFLIDDQDPATVIVEAEGMAVAFSLFPQFTTMQPPSAGNMIQGDGIFNGTSWTPDGGPFNLGYSSNTDGDTFEGVFWVGQVLAPGVDPESLYETLNAAFLTPTKGEVSFTLITAVPEPSTLVLLASAALGLVLLRRRN